MLLLNKTTEQISTADLQALIDNEVIESKYIEYKTTFVPGAGGEEKTSDKIRLLAGISSFANTDGGDFLIGIRAENGIPREFTPFEREDLDGLKLAIEQLVQTGLAPRITPVLHEIRVSESHSVLLVRLTRSWASPHRVTLAGHDKFYARHSGGRYPMDIDQLRSAFMLSGSIQQRIDRARDELLATVLKQDLVTLGPPPWIMMHLIPFESLDPTRVFDLAPARAANLNLAPVGYRDNNGIRFNFDGLLATTLRRNREGETLGILAYTQVFRNGTIESVEASLSIRLRLAANQADGIPALEVEVSLLKAFRRFLRTQQLMGVAPPIVVLVSFIGVRNWFLDARHLQNFHQGLFAQPFERDNLIIPGVIVDSFAPNRAEVFRPIFDVLWNSGGFPRCLDYTEAGVLNIPEGHFQGELVM